jgi:hypothetical protein
MTAVARDRRIGAGYRGFDPLLQLLGGCGHSDLG